MSANLFRQEVGVIGKAEEQGCFLDNLMNGVLDWRSDRVGQRVEVEGDDGDTIGELLYDNPRVLS